MALFVLFCGQGISRGQSFTLLEYTNQWRYLQGNATPTNWQGVGFAETAWPEGRGVFGVPANEQLPGGVSPINTVLTTNGPQGHITTYYFRTLLVVTGDWRNFIINGSAVIDDGAIIYINGRELRRIGMPSGPVTYSTFANRSGEVLSRIDTFSFSGTNFLVGTNVLALEVHQDSSTSSDAVLGMKLVANRLEPIAILTHPADQTIEEGFRATFSVVADGSSPHYFWYSTNRLLISTTNSFYTTPTASPALNGTRYHVVVSNAVNSVTSSVARLTVIRDERGPMATFAVADSSNRVIMKFNEPLLRASVTNPVSYSLSILGTTNQLRLTNAAYGVNMLRVTADRNLDPNAAYVICARDVMDAKTNVISPNPTCLAVSFSTTNNFIPFGATWRFDDVELGPLPPDWITLDCDDDPTKPPYHWADGQGAFAFTYSTAFTPCSPVRTALSLGPTTYYFRKRFYSDRSYPTNALLTLRHLVDDGAVFYLNGTEIHRFNLPSGPIDYHTRPIALIGDAICTSNGLAVADRIVQGTNILAVEVHQAIDAAGTTDVAFDAEFSVVFYRTPELPELHVSHNATHATLTWGSSWSLQNAESISGPWSPVTTTNYTHVAPLGGTRRFFRLAKP